MIKEAARLKAVAQALAELREVERVLLEQRAALVKQAIDRQGWKRTSRVLGVGRSRLYAMRAQGRQHA